jgi:hypothetical protein
MISLGVRAIHISGHGHPNRMVLEDGRGASANLLTAQLADMLTRAAAKEKLQFVFVSACYSSSTAEAIVAAGVPHVIAIQDKVKDTSAALLATHMYMALAAGRTVYDAFQTGQARVLAETANSAPNDSQQFLLLPVDGDHSVQLFTDVPQGQWEDCSPRPLVNNLPALPDSFLGRSEHTYQVIQYILKDRLVAVVGSPGVGKSAVACAAALYVHQRRHFSNGSFRLQLAGCSSVNDIVDKMLTVLQLHPAGERADPESQRKLLFAHLKAKNMQEPNMLFIWTYMDLFKLDELSAFLRVFAEECGECHILMTSSRPLRDIDRVQEYHLQPLHPLDAVALLWRRLRRPLTERDMPVGRVVTRLSELLPHPIFRKIQGNARLIQWCAALFNSNMSLNDLDHYLDQGPNPRWPAEHAEMLKKIHDLMVALAKHQSVYARLIDDEIAKSEPQLGE